MSNTKNIRRLFVCLAAVCLSVLFFAGCGAPEGQEDYEKGLAAYETGDYATAITHFTTAAALKHPGAQCRLGICYQEGKGVTKDWSEAVKWYQAAAEQEDEEALYRLGWCYGKAVGVEYDMRKQYMLWTLAAKLGHAKAQSEVGEFAIIYGDDDKFGLKLLRKAAEQENPAALNMLGTYCEKRKRDFREAEKWYRKAAEAYLRDAERGDAEAQLELGIMYETGQGVTKDPAEAEKWFRKAQESFHRDAEQGDPWKQMLLGVLYSMGKYGIEQNDAEVIKWVGMSATQGFMEAQELMGAFYFRGKHVEKDDAEAVRWYRKAEAQGSESAQSFFEKHPELLSPGAGTPEAAGTTEDAGTQSAPGTSYPPVDEVFRALERFKNSK